MKKKILIGVCLVVVLVLVIGGGVFGINAMIKKDPGAAYIKITAIPTKIANAIIPPPKLENKEPEERKKIIIKYLKEMEEAEKGWQLLKRMEIEKRILKMGDLIVPILIDIFSNSREKSMLSTEAHVVLRDIAEWKNKPADEMIGDDADEDWKREMYEEPAKLAKKIDIESAIPKLIEIACTDSEYNQVRNAALELLGELKDRRAVEPLIRIAKDDGFGIEELGKLGDERAVDVLIGIIEKDKGVVHSAGIWPHWKEAITSLGNIGGKRSINALMNLFKENPRDETVMEALGTAKAEEAVPMLIELLERERDFNIKDIVIEVLGNIGDGRAVESLIQILNHKSLQGQRSNEFSCITALGEIGDERAVKLLEEKMLEYEGNELFQKATAEALKKITGKEYKYKR